MYWNIPIEDFILESYRKNRYSPQARYTWTVGGGQASSALVKAEDKDVENGNSAKMESKLVQPATKFESLSQRKSDSNGAQTSKKNGVGSAAAIVAWSASQASIASLLNLAARTCIQ